MKVDLKKEQTASNKRPPYQYSLAAKVFFWSMDLVTGNKISLPKVKLIEILASIPYRSWETRQYTRMTKGYQNRDLVQESRKIMMWA